MRSSRFLAAGVLAILLGLSGCAWVPKYLEAKMAINARYEKKEENIERLYAQGRISDATYDRMYEQLYRAWDQELTVAKARAQGLDVAGSRPSSPKRRSTAPSTSPAAESARFDTYSAEYVGSDPGSPGGPPP